MKRKKGKLILHILVVALSSMIFVYCAGVQNTVPDPKVQADNLPIRTLRVVLLYEDADYIDELTALVETTSQLLREQVGIVLKITDAQAIKFESYDMPHMLGQMILKMGSRKDYDMAIAYSERNMVDIASCVLWCWAGAIDQRYRRYIILRNFHRSVLMHEIGHAFIASHKHSWGLMAEDTALMGDYFTTADRNEILKNKWRSFGDEFYDLLKRPK
jgi:hypothetical protein